VTISMSRACRGPTASPLFPYTTLFRSGRDERCEAAMVEDEARGVPWHASSFLPGSATACGHAFRATRAPPRDDKSSERASERDVRATTWQGRNTPSRDEAHAPARPRPRPSPRARSSATGGEDRPELVGRHDLELRVRARLGGLVRAPAPELRGVP